MAKLLLGVLLLSAVCSVSGCTYWYQEGKSFDECKQDRTDCLCELEKYADMGAIHTYETGFMKCCMKSKGYRLVGEGKLPYDAKREDPQMTTFWLLAGVSGTLDSGQ